MKAVIRPPLDDEPVRIPIAKLFDRRIEGQVGQRPTEMRPLEMLPVGPASQGQSGVGYADLPICRRGQFAVKLEVPAQGDRQFHQIVGVPGVVQVFTAANRPSRDRFPLAASPVARRSDPRQGARSSSLSAVRAGFAPDRRSSFSSVARARRFWT